MRVTDVTGRPKPKRRKVEAVNEPPADPVGMLKVLKRQLAYMAEGLDTHLKVVQRRLKAITKEVNEIQCDLQDEQAKLAEYPEPPQPPSTE